ASSTTVTSHRPTPEAATTTDSTKPATATPAAAAPARTPESAFLGPVTGSCLPHGVHGVRRRAAPGWRRAAPAKLRAPGHGAEPSACGRGRVLRAAARAGRSARGGRRAAFAPARLGRRRLTGGHRGAGLGRGRLLSRGGGRLLDLAGLGDPV